jgi:hypothetical protein
VQEDIQRGCALGADERFALMQLCSTAYLASGRLDEAACASLARVGFASRDKDGFWSATHEGRHRFDCLDKGQHDSQQPCPHTD